MRARQRSSAISLAAFYASYYGTVGVWLPFWPVWLEHRGLDAGEIGAVLAAGFWSRVAAGPLIARIADARGERKRPMVILSAGALAGYLAFAGAGALWQLVALSALTGAVYTVLVPFADSLTLRGVETEGLDYGRVRLWGSLAFIGASVGAGRLFGVVSAEWILWLVVAGVALTFAACAALPGGATRFPIAPRRRAGWKLLTRPRFVLCLLTCACLQASHGVYYAFATLHWERAGHADWIVGLLWAEGVAAEVLLFVGGRFFMERLGAVRLLLLAGAGGVVRWSVLGATTDLGALIGVQWLHALTFGAAHLGAMRFLSRAVPEQLSTTAQSVYSAAVGGLALGGAVSGAGLLYGRFGSGAFFIASGLSAAGIPLALLLAHSLRRDGWREGDGSAIYEANGH